MKFQLTKFERTAGFFVMTAIAGFVAFTSFVAFKQGWFEPKNIYKTVFKQGEGLHSGTNVQIAGLRAGTVEDVVLTDDNKILVTLSVTREFSKKIKKDSVVRLIRPFIISDKVVDISPGEPSSALLKAGDVIASQDTVDIMDLLGGGHLGPYLETIDSVLKNVQVLITAFGEPKRSTALVGIFDEALPMMQDVREMAQQMTRHKNLAKTLQRTSDILPDIAEFSKRLPEIGENSGKIMHDMEHLMAEMNKILPTLIQVAPQLPEASKKSVEAMKEAIIVLKAMQKSFFLKGAVQDMKAEEEEKRKQRLPAAK